MQPETAAILEALDRLYPYDGRCFLQFDKNKPWQLLFATILSAQCTDERVNQVTAKLFERYKTLEDFAAADQSAADQSGAGQSGADQSGAAYEELCGYVRSTGFFRSKAAHIIGSAKILLYEHNGQLPSDIDELTKLPGVGRKTANVVRGHIFNIPSIVVDTHVKRVSFKLGLTAQTDPVKIEQDLMAILPQEHWIRFNQQVITHAREVCAARRPRCGGCLLRGYCRLGADGVSTA